MKNYGSKVSFLAVLRIEGRNNNKKRAAVIPITPDMYTGQHL